MNPKFTHKLEGSIHPALGIKQGVGHDQ